MKDIKKILVHICCAPCATSSCERLINEGQQMILYFSNSNIYPYEEYKKRLFYAEKLANILKTELLTDDYNHEQWLNHIKGLENESEQGRRCHKCFTFSIKQTSIKAQQLNIPYITSTLTVSPHKRSADIFKIGQSFQGYLDYDFKKQNGFARSIKLSQVYDLYRQSYCGCEFSFRPQ